MHVIHKCGQCGARIELYTDGYSGLLHEREIPCVCPPKEKAARAAAELKPNFRKSGRPRKCACGADISHRHSGAKRCLKCSSVSQSNRKRKT